MSTYRPYVRRIRPTDVGYDQVSARLFPWLCLPHRNAVFGRGFRTQSLAFRFAERVAIGDATIVS